ncbi:translation initiation inhibitor, yjgF family protein, partial [Leptolyngbya sp. FACHB-36]
MKRLMSFFKWRRWMSVAICTVLISLSIFTVTALASEKAKAPRKVTFFGAPTSAISSGVSLPKNVGLYYSSGTVPPVIDSTAPAGSRERYGDTYTQAVGTLKRIEELLVEQGLTLNDVVYLTAYLVPDPL